MAPGLSTHGFRWAGEEHGSRVRGSPSASAAVQDTEGAPPSTDLALGMGRSTRALLEAAPAGLPVMRAAMEAGIAEPGRAPALR